MRAIAQTSKEAENAAADGNCALKDQCEKLKFRLGEARKEICIQEADINYRDTRIRELIKSEDQLRMENSQLRAQICSQQQSLDKLAAQLSRTTANMAYATKDFAVAIRLAEQRNDSSLSMRFPDGIELTRLDFCTGPELGNQSIEAIKLVENSAINDLAATNRKIEELADQLSELICTSESTSLSSTSSTSSTSATSALSLLENAIANTKEHIRATDLQYKEQLTDLELTNCQLQQSIDIRTGQWEHVIRNMDRWYRYFIDNQFPSGSSSNSSS